jgi:hypothetical protein
MFKTFKIAVPAVSKSLTELTSGELDRCNGLLLQTPLSNTSEVYFGERSKEYAFLVNGASAGIDMHNARDVFVKGTAPDELIIVAY